MMRHEHRMGRCLVSAALLALTSCGSEDGTENTQQANLPENAGGASATPAIDPGFGSDDDAELAAELWTQVNDADYENWPLLPDTSAQQRGQSPHGYYVTRIYDGDLEELANGVTLAKINFDPEGVFAALTIMSYRDGYDPDNNNWFYAKFLPDGALDVTPTGAPLAGAIEPGPGQGCRGCHRNAVGGDFMFWNDGSPP